MHILLIAAQVESAKIIMMEGVNLLIELLLHQFKFGLISKYFE
jgi:hypothetical protein